MQVSATTKRLRISPQKVRLIVDQVRGKPVGDALDILSFSPQKAAGLVRKVVESAIANAENNEGADIDELKISEVFVDAGLTMKRIKTRAKSAGRGEFTQRSPAHSRFHQRRHGGTQVG